MTAVEQHTVGGADRHRLSRPRYGPGCVNAASALVGLTASSVFGASAALYLSAISFLARLLIFVFVTALVAAVVYATWAFLRATPVPVSRKDNDQ